MFEPFTFRCSALAPMAMFSVPRFSRSADEPMATVLVPDTFSRRALPPIATLNEASIA